MKICLYSPECVLVAQCDGWKRKRLIVDDLDIDIDWVSMVINYSVHNLVRHNGRTYN